VQHLRHDIDVIFFLDQMFVTNFGDVCARVSAHRVSVDARTGGVVVR